MKFRDRHDAAFRLIPLLEKYSHEDGMVLAVQRGGVPLGFHISMELNMPLELLMTKKIGHPLSEEFAIGAVSCEDYVVDEGHNVPEVYIQKKILQIRRELHERYLKFMGRK